MGGAFTKFLAVPIAEGSRTDSSLQGVFVGEEMATAEFLHLPELGLLGGIDGAARTGRRGKLGGV